jgi:hypothetical protein
VASELRRLRRWLPAFADGERATWGDVADCLAAAVDALPASAGGARSYARSFAITVLTDAATSPPAGKGNPQEYLRTAGMKPRHAALLLAAATADGTPGAGVGGSAAAALGTLVAAGHVAAAAAALLAGMQSVGPKEAGVGLIITLSNASTVSSAHVLPLHSFVQSRASM